MRYQTEGEVSVVMATKLSSVPTVTENLVHKQSEGRHRRERRHHAAAYAHHRKSAVELLEASKAEYVKSTRVLNNKQELKHPENLCVSSRDGVSISPPSNSLLDEIACLQSERNPDTQLELDKVDGDPSKLEKKLTSQVKTEEAFPVIPERIQKTSVSKEEIAPPKPERKKSLHTEENVAPKSELKNSFSTSERAPSKPERITVPSQQQELRLPPTAERPSKSPQQEEIPPPRPERKPKSPANQEELIAAEQEHTNHSKPNIPPKPSVPPKPTSSKPVISPDSVSDSNKVTFVKPNTPPKRDRHKPVPPPRPNKSCVKNIVTECVAETQTSEMSEPDKQGEERKVSCSNQSTNSSNQDQHPKRFSSLSAGAAVTLSKDQCDRDAVIKGRSPASSSTVKSRELRLSSHSDNILKPLCAGNILSTSVGFLVEKKHSPIPKPRTEKQLVEKPKDLPPKRQLHRSHSDLSSCRHSRTSSDFSDLSSRISRTSTEVERFFSEMGIDRTILDPMLRLHEKGYDYTDSFSSLDSQEARSVSSRISCGGNLDQVPAESEQDLLDRDTTGTSVVERNARIIKWLCNVKKAKNSNTNINSKQNKVANV